MTSVLLVDSDVTAAVASARGLGRAVDVAVCSDFSTARARLHTEPPRLLVTALRLCEYNGLQLVYLAAKAGLPTRSIVHTETDNFWQASEIQRAGAFYEVRWRLSVTLPAYVRAVLPPHDRRDITRRDRRRASRGGRRVTDPVARRARQSARMNQRTG